MSCPLRVVHLFLSFPFGGAEDLTLSLVREKSENVESQILCISQLGNLGEKAQAEALPIQYFPWVTSRRIQPTVIWKLAQWLKEQKCDIIHSHVYNAHLYAVLAAKLAGIRAVVHHHKTFTTEKWHRLFFLRALSPWISRHITLSEQTADDIHRQLGIKRDQIEVMTNPLDREIFHPVANQSELRQKFQLPENAWLLGHVGTFRYEKNHERLLRAVHTLKNEIPSLRVVLLGNGKKFEEMKSLAHDLEISDRIIFAGAQRPIAPWLQAMDAFVFPSIWEGQPLALLQAAACQLPVLASNIEGNRSALGDTHPGLFSLDETDGLENAIRKLHQDSQWKNTILESQNEALKKIPDLSDYRKRLVALYQQITTAS